MSSMCNRMAIGKSKTYRHSNFQDILLKLIRYCMIIFKEKEQQTTCCFNCKSQSLIKQSDETSFKSFCTVCGSDYHYFKNEAKGGLITEEKTISIGTKKWKPKKGKMLFTSFISCEESKQSFIRFCEQGIKKFDLDVAEYTYKVSEDLYEKYNLISNTKSYIRPTVCI